MLMIETRSSSASSVRFRPSKVRALHDRQQEELRRWADLLGVNERESRRALAQVEEHFGDIELRARCDEADLALHHLAADRARYAAQQQEHQVGPELVANHLSVLQVLRRCARSGRQVFSDGHEQQRAAVQRALPNRVTIEDEVRQIGGCCGHEGKPLSERVLDVRFGSFRERFQPRLRNPF
jgi:hypothetical protein